ncbi:MAG: hypothetical protein WCE75_08510 [Terracidiphilus sp.]
MTILRFLPVLLVTAALTAPALRAGQNGPGEALTAPAATEALTLPAAPGGGAVPNSNLYARGTLALNEGHWADAAQLFAMAAAQKDSTADGALYWEAYAENKLGHTDRALATCVELRKEYPASSWLDECGALVIEIKARNGQPVALEPGQSDELKLLALNALLRQDEPRALAAIASILNSDAPEKLKQGVVFLLNEHHDNVSYPQIVRLSHVEGDVRVSRGNADEKTGVGDWEQAQENIQIYTGFSLATGVGRAEIELENASTIYLAEDSVLLFNDLETLDGKPRTEAALLAGTATLHVKPFVQGEWFQFRTPTDTLVTRFGASANFRVTAYMDAMALTSLAGDSQRLPGTAGQPVAAGVTSYFNEGRLVQREPGMAQEDFTAWDKWVAARYTDRTAAINEVMQAAGLPEPIPGLNELRGQGRFFECAPYGTCWEPNDADKEEAAAGSAETPAGEGFRSPGQSAGGAAAAPRKPSPTPTYSSIPIDGRMGGFPCFPESIRYRVLRDPATGRNRVIDTQPSGRPLPWDWALCHAGTWIPHGHGYRWVVGRRRHHHPPVRWVKTGKTVAIVPLHPRDVKGQLPVNRVHQIFAVPPRDGARPFPIHLDPGHRVVVLNEPPKEFRVEHLAPLPLAEAPHMEAHNLRAAPGEPKAGASPHPVSVPIHFDHRTQSFVVARQVMQGTRPVTVLAPIGNHPGALQSRTGFGSATGGGTTGFGGGGGYHPVSGGTVASGGSHSGGSSGGGSHAGGGATTTSSVSSSSSSPASSSTSAPAHH